jgi:hypothetical protein
MATAFMGGVSIAAQEHAETFGQHMIALDHTNKENMHFELRSIRILAFKPSFRLFPGPAIATKTSFRSKR